MVRGRAGPDRGDGPVGQVIGAGIVVLGLALLIQFGLGLHTQRVLGSVVGDSAASGARHGADRVEARRVAEEMVSASAGSLLDRWTIEVDLVAADTGPATDPGTGGGGGARQLLVVSIEGTFAGPLGSWPVSASAAAPVEAFVAQADR